MNKDEQLRQKIIDELKWDATITNPAAIGASVQDGIVTLSGYADNLIDALAAEELVANFPGVRGVVQNIKLLNTAEPGRRDFDIAGDVCGALAAKGMPHDRVTAVVDKGWVTLTGIVYWPAHKDDAEAAARSVPGVTGVTNNIAVRPPLTSGDVKKEITKALEKIVAHHVSHLDVAVDEGRVTLTGQVRAIFEKFEVERIVREMPGVTEVENGLVVCPLAEALDKQEAEKGGTGLPAG